MEVSKQPISGGTELPILGCFRLWVMWKKTRLFVVVLGGLGVEEGC